MSTLLKSIYLSTQDYGKDKGMMIGSAEFHNEFGEVKINIRPEHAAKIVEILAEALVATTRETAALMTSQVIEQSRLSLEAP